MDCGPSHVVGRKEKLGKEVRINRDELGLAPINELGLVKGLGMNFCEDGGGVKR